MAATTKAQSLHRLKKLGWWGVDVERYLRGRRWDFHGIGDLIAWHESDVGVHLIQTTTAGNLSAHRKKIEAAEMRLLSWLGEGRYFELWAWKKPPKSRRSGPLELRAYVPLLIAKQWEWKEASNILKA